MCDAVSIAVATEATGTLLAGAGAKQRGAAAKAAGNRSADSAERAAADALDRGQLKDAQTAMRGEAVIAEELVLQSGRGADVNIGSNLAVRTAAQAATEADRAVVRRNAALEAYGLVSHARALRQQGEYARAEGDNAALGTFLGGLGKIAGQAGKRGADVPSSSAGPLPDGTVTRDEEV